VHAFQGSLTSSSKLLEAKPQLRKKGSLTCSPHSEKLTTVEAVINATLTSLTGVVSQLLDVDKPAVLPERSFISYGLDFLTAMELMKHVNSVWVSSVQMLEIMNPIPLLQFGEVAASRSARVGDGLFRKKEIREDCVVVWFLV
jgi:aryl carrier-like protein